MKVSDEVSSCSNNEMEKLRMRLKDDAESGGFELSIAILANTPSTNIENTCKALLYAHHRDHNDVALMKALIKREVTPSSKADVIFRANTAATLTFKHMSKMVGLDYLFATLWFSLYEPYFHNHSSSMSFIGNNCSWTFWLSSILNIH